ncbi:nucleotidyltransferase family protein [Pseudohalioglobus lutimaris]|uniref:nucleotidyltransferase family protein n=1 Tax=Pseudohalioglobus lutimaris TaxID=1737061 RepID=UPI0013FD252F|nr:nucleotidyltransferase family protein [Pseudohalioglobus lutimaris]
MNVTILLLAAGTSRRFGRDKRRALLPDGTTILERTTAQALASGLPVMVCLRPSDEELAGALQSLGAQTLLCSLAYRGMGHTLAQGLERVKQEDGVLIALGDMPHIQPASYRAVAEALCPGTITLPQCNGSTGHPVGFSREFFTELAALTGDRGARQVIGRNENAIVRVALTDTGIFTDIDSPADIT